MDARRPLRGRFDKWPCGWRPRQHLRQGLQHVLPLRPPRPRRPRRRRPHTRTPEVIGTICGRSSTRRNLEDLPIPFAPTSAKAVDRSMRYPCWSPLSAAARHTTPRASWIDVRPTMWSMPRSSAPPAIACSFQTQPLSTVPLIAQTTAIRYRVAAPWTPMRSRRRAFALPPRHGPQNYLHQPRDDHSARRQRKCRRKPAGMVRN